MIRAEWDREYYTLWRRYMYDNGLPMSGAGPRALADMTTLYGPRPAADPKLLSQDRPRASWILRLGTKAAGSLLRSEMKDKLNRWLPIVGVVVVAVSAGLKAFGLTEVASILDVFGSAVGATAGVSGDTVATIAQGAGALAALYGVARKLISVYAAKNARGNVVWPAN